MNRSGLICISSTIFICIISYFLSPRYTTIADIVELVVMWGTVYIGTVVYIICGSILLRKFKEKEKSRYAAIGNLFWWCFFILLYLS